MAYEELIMVREDLNDLPTFPLPPGFSIRWHRAGDEETWIALQAPFYEPGAVTLKLFHDQFGTDLAALSQRICYLLDRTANRSARPRPGVMMAFAGRNTAASTGWRWRASTRGKGSARLFERRLQRLVELGHTKAYLTTDRERPVAVALYRGFGFAELDEGTVGRPNGS